MARGEQGKQKVVSETYACDSQQCDHRAGITYDPFPLPLLVKTEKRREWVTQF